MTRQHKTELSNCRTCGEDFQARFRGNSLRIDRRSGKRLALSITCSRLCGHIYGASSRNIRGKGHSGGFRLKNFYLVGKAMSEKPGVPIDCKTLENRLYELVDTPLGRDTPNSQSIASALTVLSNNHFVKLDGHPIRWVVNQPVNCLMDMLDADKYERLVANYSEGSE